jgi:hypothetical protein
VVDQKRIIRKHGGLRRRIGIRGKLNKKLPSQDSSSDSESKSWEWKKTQLVLFTKLFVVMGLSWLSEIIHFELHGDHTKLSSCSLASEVTGKGLTTRAE